MSIGPVLTTMGIAQREFARGTGRVAAGRRSMCRHSRPARWISEATGASVM